jgi:CBS domain-containing protein
VTMKTLVRDVMTPDVVSVTEHAPYKEIVYMLVRYRVGSLPVVGARGQVRGVVSEDDLLFREADADAEAGFGGAHGRRSERRESMTIEAAELMTSPAVTVTPAMSVERAARTMRRHKVKRLPVIEASTGRLVGVVSRSDVLKVYTRPDGGIRDDVLRDVIVNEFGLDPSRFTVEVWGGQVTVSGETERRTQIPLLLRSIRHVEGVVAVHSRLGYRADDLFLALPA